MYKTLMIQDQISVQIMMNRTPSKIQCQSADATPLTLFSWDGTVTYSIGKSKHGAEN